MKPKTPKNIQYKHGAYYYVIKRAGKVKWTRLGKTESEMYSKLAKIKLGETTKNTMSEVFSRYTEKILPTLAETTQKYYEGQLIRLNKVFGHMPPKAITTVMVYEYLDTRAETALVQANREVSLLSKIFSFCKRWGMIEHNPCKDMEMLIEEVRDRYISHDEYHAVYEAAKPLIKITMEFAVIAGLRQRDILDLQLSNLKNDGIHVTTNKSRKKLIIKWTPDLKVAIKQAKSLRKVTSSTYLICNQKGKAYTSSGFKSMWQKTMNKALKDNVIQERFTFRDLRPKAASDHDDGTKLLAHSDSKTTKKYYLRKPAEVVPSR